MATTIPSAFQTLKQNLEITGLQKSTVATRQKSVREAIEDDLTVNESFLTGSYSKHTMIAPLEKADVGAILQHRHDGVAGFAFAGFVDGDDAVFPFLAALLVRQSDFAFNSHTGVGPRAGRTFAALDFVGRDLASVDRGFLFLVDLCGAYIPLLALIGKECRPEIAPR